LGRGSADIGGVVAGGVVVVVVVFGFGERRDAANRTTATGPEVVDGSQTSRRCNLGVQEGRTSFEKVGEDIHGIAALVVALGPVGNRERRDNNKVGWVPFCDKQRQRQQEQPHSTSFFLPVALLLQIHPPTRSPPLNIPKFFA